MVDLLCVVAPVAGIAAAVLAILLDPERYGIPDGD